MRRILLSTLLAFAAVGGTGMTRADVCLPANVFCGLQSSCTGIVNYCPNANSCRGGISVNVCENAEADCSGSIAVNVCAEAGTCSGTANVCLDAKTCIGPVNFCDFIGPR